MTRELDYESRVFLLVAAAYALRCMNNNSYKCAIFMRGAAEALLQDKKIARARGAA